MISPQRVAAPADQTPSQRAGYRVALVHGLTLSAGWIVALVAVAVATMYSPSSLRGVGHWLQTLSRTGVLRGYLSIVIVPALFAVVVLLGITEITLIQPARDGSRRAASGIVAVWATLGLLAAYAAGASAAGRSVLAPLAVGHLLGAALLVAEHVAEHAPR